MTLFRWNGEGELLLLAKILGALSLNKNKMKNPIKQLLERWSSKPPDDFMYPRDVDGHRFWVIKDPLFHATRRILALNYKLHESQLSVTSDDLRAIVDTGNESVRQGDISKCGFLFHLLGTQMDLYCTRKALFQVANCIILLDGEPFKTMSQEHTAKKQHIFDTNQEVKSFFFSIAQRFLTRTGVLLQDMNVEEYLNQKSVQFTDDLFTKWLQKEGNHGNTI